MAIRVEAVAKPVIKINGQVIGNVEVENSDKNFTGNRTPTLVTYPATVTITGPANAVIRYTFNSKKVNLSSPRYRGASKPHLRSNGNGFNSDTTTIRAKAFVNGESSATAEAVVQIRPGNPGREAPSNQGD